MYIPLEENISRVRLSFIMLLKRSYYIVWNRTRSGPNFLVKKKKQWLPLIAANRTTEHSFEVVFFLVNRKKCRRISDVMTC